MEGAHVTVEWQSQASPWSITTRRSIRETRLKLRRESHLGDGKEEKFLDRKLSLRGGSCHNSAPVRVGESSLRRRIKNYIYSPREQKLIMQFCVLQNKPEELSLSVLLPHAHSHRSVGPSERRKNGKSENVSFRLDSTASPSLWRRRKGSGAQS
jgi:hypothetical protein